MRRSRIVLGVGVVVAAALWWMGGQDAADGDEPDEVANTTDSGNNAPGTRNSKIDLRSGAIATHRRGDGVVITGRVFVRPIDTTALRAQGKLSATDEVDGIGNAEVVFRGAAGEETTTTGPDGNYRIELAAGTYRAFVRGDDVLMIGRSGRVRLPSAPEADSIDAPDETAMPIVVAARDQDHLDLEVAHAGTITGHVRDRAGRPIAHAIVRANGSPKPVLGSDVAETDAQGAFTMRVPYGNWTLDATHPRYAGLSNLVNFYIGTGRFAHPRASVDLTMIAGCVISGKVIGATGGPANEGAIELKLRPEDGEAQEFAPRGKILADGTFRWVTTDTVDVTLRAWPWKSPPSPAQSFSCTDGARFENVVFQLPAKGPDIDGTLADASGAPIALAYLDLVPLDPGGIGQQERTDSEGHWGVFQMPPGRYQVSAYAQGKGVVTTTVTSPQHGVALTLGGTGSIAGTAPAIKNGSFELRLHSCGAMVIHDDSRIVGVVDGSFSVEDLPACDLNATAVWNDRTEQVAVHITKGGVATVTFAFAPKPEPEPEDGIDDGIDDGLGEEPIDGDPHEPFEPSDPSDNDDDMHDVGPIPDEGPDDLM